MTLQELWAKLSATLDAWAHQIWTADLSKIGLGAIGFLIPIVVFVVLLLPLRTERYGGWLRSRPKAQLAHVIAVGIIGLIILLIFSN
jgi:hypothetical protein